MAIVIFVSFMAQVAETHIYTWVFSEIFLATVNHYLVMKYSIVSQFAEIFMYQYVRLLLVT